MNNDLMFSSVNQAWETRWHTFNQIQEKLGRNYNLDPCCEKETSKCDNFLTKEDDMFKVENPFKKMPEGTLSVNMFINPPYAREQKKFVEKVADWCEYDNIIADVLIPSRTGTQLFHDIILPKATSIYFIKGRLVFGEDSYWQWLWEQEFIDNGKGGLKKNTLYKKYNRRDAAPFDSMIVTFGEKTPLKITDLVLDKENYKKY